MNPWTQSTPEQILCYLVVGAGNTAFGYASFAGITFLLENTTAHAYLAAYLLSNFFSITFAFLCYKWFVFRTKGNYLREWVRCMGVYSGGIAIGFVLLPMLVLLFRDKLGYEKGAPYLAGAVVMGVTVVMSFFGHKHFSFRSTSDPRSALKPWAALRPHKAGNG